MTRFEQWLFAGAFAVIGLLAVGACGVLAMMALDSERHSPPTIEACPAPKK